MTIDFDALLSKFEDIADFEYEGRVFRTNAQSIAPRAYLNIYYRAAVEEIQKTIIESLGLPQDVREFYRTHNGANLFVGAIHIYGFLPPGQLIERGDWRKRLPHNFIIINEEYFPDLILRNSLCLGSYGYDLSMVCVSRDTGEIICVEGSNFNRVRAKWGSFESWLTSEIVRLSNYFDSVGHRLVDIERTLPLSRAP